MTPSADASAIILTERIRSHQPTLFLRFGDGAVECIHGPSNPKFNHTCDGEVYSPALGAYLRLALRAVNGGDTENVFFGDWRTAESPGSKPQRILEWECLIRPNTRKLLHFEALLLMRVSEALLDFYRAVRADRRRKLFVGPACNHGAARMLQADHLVVPDRDLFASTPWIRTQLDRLDPQLVLFGAGMAGNGPVIGHWSEHQDRSYIALGSAMDPLFKGRTRSNQIRQDQAQKLFKEML